MGHLVKLYYPEAGGGSFVVASYGASSSNPSVFSDYACTTATTARSLNSSGRASFYVQELVTVTVKNASGTTVDTFTDGVRAEAVQVQTASLTGTNSSGSQVAGGAIALKDALDQLATSFGARDFKVRETGTNVDKNLKDALQAVRSNNSQVFNVTQPPYNATGDGVTNDDAAVQAALAALTANGGGTLYFPAGTYLLGQTISFLSSGIMQGDGWMSSVITSSNATAAVTASSFTLQFSVRDITIETTSNTALVLSVEGSGNDVRNCKFTGPAGGNNPVRWKSDGNVQDCLFLNRVTTANLGQLDITDASYTPQGVYVSGNRFALDGPAISATGDIQLSVYGNIFEYDGYVDIIYANITATGQLTVFGNSVPRPAGGGSSNLISTALTHAGSIAEAGNTLVGTTGSCNPVRPTATLSNCNSLSKTGIATASGANTAPRLGAFVTYLSTGVNVTIAAPVFLDGTSVGTSAYEGAEVRYQLHNSSGGAITVTLTGGATGLHGTATNLAAGNTRTYSFRYVSVGAVAGWIQQGAIVDVT